MSANLCGIVWRPATCSRTGLPCSSGIEQIVAWQPGCWCKILPHMPKQKLPRSEGRPQEGSTETGSAEVSSLSWLKPFIPQIMAAALGFLGVVIGALTPGHQQLV